MSSADWGKHLQEGEEIVWQGRPDVAISLGVKEIGMAIFGTFFAGFALFWMIAASRGDGGFWMFGLLHFSVGASLVAWSIFGGAFRRKRTWYTLTNRRAFIASDMPIRGRSLKSYPITQNLPIDYLDNAVPSILFATETKRGKNGTHDVPVGFERIADAPRVLEHIRKIQQGDA